ncbi:DNA damage-regulated autophagy modulator protein 1-like [Tachypleus tridentatus]|uniref:DNA damage-regulated autophagy modulator protein 1-like n=1 Tax=Tachypleus tridentatus TaxID=6853 RepID=UPI003FD12D5E
MTLNTCPRLGWLPALTGIFLACGCLVAYIIAVLRGDVTPYMPFISEAGTDPPQSGIFSIFLFCSGCLGLITMTIRYVSVTKLNKNHIRKIQVANCTSFFCGIVAIGGMIVVAVYPMSSLKLAHDIGAYALFFVGMTYAFLQTLVSYFLYPNDNGLAICRIRLTFATLCLVSLIINILSLLCFIDLNQVSVMIFYPISSAEFDSGNYSHTKRLKHPGEKGFVGLVISSAAEWTMAFNFIFYFFTYIQEFQKITLQCVIYSLDHHFDESSNNQTDENRPLLFKQV